MMKVLLMVATYMEALLKNGNALMVAQKPISGPHPNDLDLYRVTPE